MDIDKPSLVFGILALVVTLGGAGLVLPTAMLPEAEARTYGQPTPAEELGEVDVGDGFGVMAVSELAYYYAANPPAPVGGGTADAPVQRRFGGC
ncbi:MAG: hypothetical protein WCZ23_00855 [Rhodospirillaceae bacterium]